ncbi:MAG TPA: hypothetical protein VHL79_00625, partial [Ramlibacter sp.]|jgi:hypothetical protein|nr:hypothetical protein [Ramlibacter sp.]
VLPEPTRGQAETVLKGLEQVHAEGAERLLIFNIDTIRPGFRFAREYVESDGCLEVFPGDGEHWSFVRPAGDGSQRVLETTEKRRISNLCSTGLYYFARLGDFQRLCTAAVSDADNFCREWRELYVAPLYNAFIAGGADVRYHQVDPKEVVFSGTPQEYEDMLRGHSAATSSPAP